MAVITISRELGSEGDTIARQIANHLGYHFVDKAFIGNLLSQYGLVEFDKEYDSLPTFWEKFNAQREERRGMMVDMLNRAVRALAQHDNVIILGRSGFAILSNFSEVLNVRIQAPLSLRVKRLMMRKNITADQAEGIIREGDRVRSAFIQSFYGVRWDIASAFDLSIDTSKVPPELAVEWIVSAVDKLTTEGTSVDSSITSIHIDPILATAISNELAKLEIIS
jgi:cytidylate kinase